MVVCCHCEFICNVDSIMIKHLSSLHAHEPFFRCMESECLRSFHNINSFAKHRKKEHFCPVISVNSPIMEPVLLNEIRSIELDDGAIVGTSYTKENSNLDIPCTKNIDSVASKIEIIHPEYKLQYLAKLHSYGDVPRSRVVNIVNDTSDFISEEIESIIIDLKNCNLMNDDLEKKLNERKRPFKSLETEFLQFKAFSKTKTYVPPEQILLGVREEYRKKRNIMTLTKIKTTAEFIPIRHVLRIFFELPGYYIETINYINDLKDKKLIRNFIQSPFWQNQIQNFHLNKTVFPVMIYFDDYENNNPLGSHAGLAKCGAVYFFLPFLPENLRSKLNNIFLFVLFNTLDRKMFKNKIIFNRMIMELQFLAETGITININNELITIYFQLTLILGDNLGLHSLLGFSESFRASFPCRFCLISFNDLNNFFLEDDLVLRNESNYAEHVKNITSGSSFNVVEECVFHKLKFFHVTKNLSVDVMHDVWEGVVQYDLAKILNVYVNVNKFFTLDQLNQRILAFPYEEWENKVVEIQQSHLKTKLKMSSAETMTFLRNFALFLGDLVPEDDPHWDLFLSLKKFVEVVMDKVTHSNSHKYLKILIYEYLSLLNEMFPGSMKPKHHHLVHYPRILQLMGPLWLFSSMRFESRHKEGKKISRSGICRINVSHTIAVKSQLQLNYKFVRKNPVPPIFTFGPVTHISLSELPSFPEFRNVISISDDHLATSFKWIVRFSKKIFPGNILVEYNDENNDPSFFKLEFFIHDPINGLLILAQKYNDCFYFDPHFQSYFLFDVPKFSNWKMFFSHDVIHSNISNLINWNAKEYINVNSF